MKGSNTLYHLLFADDSSLFLRVRQRYEMEFQAAFQVINYHERTLERTFVQKIYTTVSTTASHVGVAATKKVSTGQARHTYRILGLSNLTQVATMCEDGL